MPTTEQLEEAYFKYRKAKHTWRKLAGRPTRRFRKQRRYGQGPGHYMGSSSAASLGSQRQSNRPKGPSKDKNGQITDATVAIQMNISRGVALK